MWYFANRFFATKIPSVLQYASRALDVEINSRVAQDVQGYMMFAFAKLIELLILLADTDDDAMVEGLILVTLKQIICERDNPRTNQL